MKTEIRCMQNYSKGGKGRRGGRLLPPTQAPYAPSQHISFERSLGGNTTSSDLHIDFL